MTTPREKGTQTDRQKGNKPPNLLEREGPCWEVCRGVLWVPGWKRPIPALTSRPCPLLWGPLWPHSSQESPGVQAVFCPKGPRPPTSPAGSHSNSARVGRLLGAQGLRSPPGPGQSGSPSTSKSWSSVLASSNTWTKDRGQRSWGCKIGSRAGDSQGGPYKAVADQLGLQPLQPPENALSVGSEGPQDLLQGHPGLRLTPLRQPLTECQQCIYTLSCPMQVCL